MPTRLTTYLLAALALAGCATRPMPELVNLADGTTVELSLGEECEREEADGRVALRGADGLVVTLQEVDAEHRETDGRRPRDVAAALALRMELGEREGELSHLPCRVGGLDGECISGWMVRDDARYARSGVVFQAGSRIVWLDVAGPQARVADVTARSQALRESLHVRPGHADG